MRTIQLDRYKADLRAIGGPNELSSGAYIGRTRLYGGPDLYFKADIHPSGVLRVHMHGAMGAADTYPRFEGVTTATQSGDAYVSFADPTVAVDPALTLGWFLGGREWDPATTMVKIIRAAASLAGAEKIVVTGGSAGGFAALRLGLMVPEALVYCFNPQTSVLNYYKNHIDRYVSALHGATVKPEELVEREPERFDLVQAYGSAADRPALFYAQNLSDGFHVERHYVPFKRAVGLSDVHGTHEGYDRANFLLYDGERLGHRPPTPAEYKAQFDEAMSWYERRGSTTHVPQPSKAAVSPNQSDDLRWRRVLAELADLKRHVVAIQSGDHSQSLRRRLVGDLMSVAAVRDFPVDRRPVLKGWAMSPEVLRYVLAAIEDSPARSTIVELGSGPSTSWIASTLKRAQLPVTFVSLEHDTSYFEQTRAELESAGLSDAVDLRLAPLTSTTVVGRDFEWYSSWEGDRDVSLLIVDGPPARVGPQSRFPALLMIQSRLRDGGIVVLDDADRADEKRTVEEWRELAGDVAFDEIARIDRAAVLRVRRRPSGD